MLEFMSRNSVYEWDNQSFRLLDNFGGFAVFIDIVEHDALPFKLTVEQISELDNRQPIMRVSDPWRESVNRHFNEGHDYLAIRDGNLARIQGVIGNYDYWDKPQRAELIKVLVAMKVAAKSTIYRYLRRYWQRGQTPNALLPDYANCGGKGKRKTRGDKRLGRPKQYGSYDSSQSSPEMEYAMELSIRQTIFSNKYVVDKKGKPNRVFDLSSSYYDFLARWCEGDVRQLVDEKPSFDLFKAFYYCKFSPEERARAKVGEKYFNANVRKLTSAVSANLVGPGYSYEIDATPFDVGLADTDRFPLGRPTLYEVVDSDSSSMVGFLLTLTPPSYFNAMNAMVVAVRDKVELCREFGLDIESKDWPMEGLPKAFFGDLGSDLRSKKITSVTVEHGTTMINSGAGQPEKRSKVERSFGRLYKTVKHLIPGLISSHLPKKHGGKYRPQDYTLLLSELNKILAGAVMAINSKPMGVGKVDTDYPSDLSTSPNSKWHWGIAHRTAPLHSVDAEYFWYSLLEREEATLSKGYILTYQHLKFEIPDALGIRTKVFNNRQKVEVAIDPSNASTIYLVPQNGETKYIKCPLHVDYRRFEGLTWRDATLMYKEIQHSNADDKHRSTLTTLAWELQTKKDVSAAKADKKFKSKDRTKAEHLSRLGDNKVKRAESKDIYDSVKPVSARETLSQKRQGPQVVHANKPQNQLFMDDED
jgi:transposase InsO family protein